MSDLAYVHQGEVVDPNPASRGPRDRIRQGRDHRRQFEPIWQLNAAFAAGQHWLVADRLTRSLRRVQDVDPDYQGRELYAFDVINEYRTTALGELGSDDDRPELLLERDDRASEDFQAQANRALGYGWDFEWRGNEALSESDRMCVDLGTAAVQVSFDPTQGPVRNNQVPHHNGQPVFGQNAYDLLQGGPRPDVQMRSIREGRISWRPLSPFNLIVPPGVTHEKYFPWECTVVPTPLDEVKARYGQPAAELREDADIGSILGMQANQQNADPTGWVVGESRQTRLRDHVWLFTYYERPTSKFPEGRTLVFASNRMKLLDSVDQLPCEAPDGTRVSGLEWFHWWRVTGRFWSRSLVSAMQDIQRAMNKRETQKNEIVDRGMPFVLVEEANREALEGRSGRPLEIIPLQKQAAGPPIVHPGIGPGEWMYKDLEEMRAALEHASGIRAPTLGENPANVNTYSQLALIHESDITKRLPIYRDRKSSIGRLVEHSLYNIRTYWGHQKQIRLAGDDDQVQAEVFDATRLPSFFIVKPAEGTAKPRTQAAELKKVEQIWQAALDAQQPLPVKWLRDSLNAGEPLELPEQPADAQHDKAERENHLLLEGQPAPVAYYDLPEVHIPVHRHAQIQAEMSGDVGMAQLIEQHIQEHLAAAAQHAQEMAQIAAPAAAGAQDAQAQYDQAAQQAAAAQPPAGQDQAAGAAPQQQPPAGPQHLSITLPDHHVHVSPTPVEVQHHAGPTNVHVSPTPVNVHVPEHKPPAPKKKGKRKVVIERDARGNVTGAEVHD